VVASIKPEPTVAQKVAGGVDWSLRKAEDAASGVAHMFTGAPEPTAAQKVAAGVGSVVDAIIPEPTFSEKVAAGVDSALKKTGDAIASAVHTVKGDGVSASASQPASQPASLPASQPPSQPAA